jgi:hypothetical protein
LYGPNVVVGNVYRGQVSTYVTGGTNYRDADHWAFTPPAAGVHQYQLVINANFTGSGNFMTSAASTCGAIAFIVPTAAWTNNTNFFIPVFTAGLDSTQTYSIRIRPAATTGMACPGPFKYSFIVIGPLN